MPVIGANKEPNNSLESSYVPRRESSTLLCGGAGRCSRSFTDRCLNWLWRKSRVLGYPKGVKRPFRKKVDYRRRHGDIKWLGLFWITAKLFVLVGKRKESVGRSLERKWWLIHGWMEHHPKFIPYLEDNREPLGDFKNGKQGQSSTMWNLTWCGGKTGIGRWFLKLICVVRTF